MSELALQLIAENKKTRNPYLDLGNCGLTHLPKELGECVWLETLVLSGWWEEYDLKKKDWVVKNTANQGAPNELESLEGVEQLLLQALVVGGGFSGGKWKLSDLGPLRGLLQLKNLNLSRTSVSNLSPLRGLLQLQSLDFRSTPVNDLSPLRGLLQLQSLDFRSTSVSDLGPLSGLLQLQSLFFSNASVSDLGPLSGLLHLQSLDFRMTLVSDLGPLRGLLQLQSLDFNRTLVSDLGPLSDLLQLQSLDFWSTSVSDLGPLRGLLQLRRIDCAGCPIKTIPPEIAFSGDGQLIRNYLLSNPDTPFNEVKLILSGNTRAGKTNLADFLRKGDDYQFSDEHDSSHGVLVGRWEVEKAQLPRGSRLDSLTVNIWDFGGQDFYHGTHNLFFRHGAVYALLWEQHKTASGAAEDQCLPEDYWLEDIRHHAPNHPVLVVQNKTDRDDQHRLPDEWLTLYDLAPGDEFHLSIKNAATQPDSEDRDNWDSFVKKLVRRLCVVPEQTEIKINYNWLKIRDYLRELQSDQPLSEGNPFSTVSPERPYLSTEEFAACCTQVAEDFAQFADVFLKVFDQRGVLIHFDEHEQLKDWVFLNPEWVTRRIYDHLLTPELRSQQGKFTRAYAHNCLGADADLLLELMLRYQVVFADPRQADTFVAVQYLPKFDPNNDIDFHYEKLEKPWLEMHLPLFHQRRIFRQLTVRLGADKSYQQHLLRHDCLLLAAPDRTLIRVEGSLDGSVGRMKIFAENPEWCKQMFLEVLMLYFEQYWEFGIPRVNKYRSDPQFYRPEREAAMRPFFTQENDFDDFIQILDELGEDVLWGNSTFTDEAIYPTSVPAQPQVAQVWARFFCENKQRASETWEDNTNLDDETIRIVSSRAHRFLHLTQSLHLRTNQAQNWVPFANLINTPQATEAADTNGQIVKTQPFAPLLKALGFEIPKKPLSVFVSYSKHDRDKFLEPLLGHLEMLVRGGKIILWENSQIRPGEERDSVIRAQIEQADVFLLLVSTHSLSTEYIWYAEIEAAMQRYPKRSARVIPMILSRCDWQRKNDLGEYVFPLAGLSTVLQAVEVTDLPRPEDAWQAIADALEEIYQDLRGK